jgi:glycosyltransferase involved in cell wall biosynthesis
VTARVAFITNFCPHYRRPLFELLTERLDVDFYFHSESGERYSSRELQPQAGAFRRIPLRPVKVLGQPLLLTLPSHLRRDRYDVVVKCLNGKLMVPFVFGLAKARRLPIVLWTGMWHHPTTFLHRLSRPLTNSVYRAADSIVVYGEHVARHIGGVPRVNFSKIFVAGQAADTTRLASLRHDPDSQVILFVGQLEERKGIRDLLEAFARLPPESRLRLVGTGSLEPLVREAAQRNNHIEVVGHVPQAALGEELAGARCLVLPSITTPTDREPWGLVVNEAMAVGVPVVVSDAVGAAAGGLVVDGENGFVIPEKEPERLRQALAALLANSELASRLGFQARNAVAAFSYQRMVDAFEAAIEYAIDQHQPAAPEWRRLYA